MATKKTPATPIAPQLTKREYFAAFALNGLLCRDTVLHESVELAVAAADLLVHALNGRRDATQS